MSQRKASPKGGDKNVRGGAGAGGRGKGGSPKGMAAAKVGGKGGRDKRLGESQQDKKTPSFKMHQVDGLGPLFTAVRSEDKKAVTVALQRLGVVPLEIDFGDEDAPWDTVAKTERSKAICKSKINETDAAGDTPLHVAARLGNASICELLVKQGSADPNHPRKQDGVTPLFVASSLGHIEVARILIGAGGGARNYRYDVGYKDPTAPNPFLPVDRPEESKSSKSSKSTKTSKTSKTSKSSKGGKGGRDAENSDDDDDGVVNKRTDDTGFTPLFMACSEGKVDMVKMLLKESTSDLMTRSSKAKNTPLIIAVHNGHTECVRLLIQKAIAIDQVEEVVTQKNKYGFTAYEAAKKGSKKEMMQFLAKHGAEIRETRDISAKFERKGIVEIREELNERNSSPGEELEYHHNGIPVTKMFGPQDGGRFPKFSSAPKGKPAPPTNRRAQSEVVPSRSVTGGPDFHLARQEEGLQPEEAVKRKSKADRFNNPDAASGRVTKAAARP